MHQPDEVDYLFSIAFEAIVCTGLNQIRDVSKLRKISHEYYKIALKNDEIRSSLLIAERQLAES